MSSSPFHLTINICTMVLDQVTVSSFTATPDNLTQIHAESDLQTVHISRHTHCGFLIKESRLPKCIPLPANKVSRRSWVWEHGILSTNSDLIRNLTLQKQSNAFALGTQRALSSSSTYLSTSQSTRLQTPQSPQSGVSNASKHAPKHALKPRAIRLLD